MITDIINPIKLLVGSHDDTSKTGQGCFMNVIAYLNGEPQITDKSECVCFVVRPIVIWLNDYLTDDERHRMIPYIERAMGSRTENKDVITQRLKALVKFSDRCAKYSVKSAEYASKSAVYAAKYAKYAKYANYDSKSAKYVAKSAPEYAKYAANYANYAAKYAEYANFSAKSAAMYATESASAAAKSDELRANLINAAFDFLDEALPKQTQHEETVIFRAKELVSLSQ